MSAGASSTSGASTGISRQQLIIVGTSCLVLIIFALMTLPGSGEQPIVVTSPSFSPVNNNNNNNNNNNGNKQPDRGDDDPPPPPPTSKKNAAPAPAPVDDNNEHPQQSGVSNNLPPYTQQIRYMPSRFERGQHFTKEQTPLTLIRDGKAPLPATPKDWDGGYGWKFVKYHPSKWELDWREASPAVERKAGHPLCDLRQEKFAHENKVYMDSLNRMPPNDGSQVAPCKEPTGFPQPKEPMEFDDKVFSRFEYEFVCTLPPCRSPPPRGSPKIGARKFTYIEPLTGLLRHPMACSNNYNWIINKNYMVVDPWSLVNPSRTNISPKPRVLYFDGGASLWDAGAGGASQSWFHAVYNGMCLNFTDWFMWELGLHKAPDVFKNIPGHVKSGYRWFNIPLKTELDSWDNPLNQMLLEAKKEDVVIVKIDFDAPVIENQLIETIIKYPEVAELIDELYWENHVRQEILQNYWGTGHMTVFQSDSAKLFAKLREMGVRAHSWV